MDLDVIRRGLDALREYDTDLDLFGAREHRYRFEPPLDEATLEDVETRIGVRFPADYRTFLTRLGNGGAGPYYGVHGVRPDGSWTRFGPFPFTEEWEPPTDDEGYDDAMEAAFEGLLPVAEHGCGYRSHLVVNGSAAGQVWGDWTCVGEALAPQAESFGTWYHDWLEVSLREVLGERIEATVRDETGWSVDRRLLGFLPPPLADDDEQPAVRVLRLARRVCLALYERRDGDARDLLARARAVGADGDHEAVRLALAEAVLLREEGRITDALTVVEHAIPRNGWWLDRSWLHRLRVELLLAQGRLDDAHTAAEEHIARCPNDDFGYVRRALLRVLAGAPSAAEEVLRADAPLGRGLRSAGHPRTTDRAPVALRLRARRLAWECRRWGHATDAPRFDAIAVG